MEVRESIPAYKKERISIKEYLEMEQAAKEKHEYYQGEVFAMSGAKVAHNKIAVNCLISLGLSLKGKN